VTTRRFVATCIIAFLVSQILEVLIHGVVLAADYSPFYGTLLRPMDKGPDWHGLLLPVAHLSCVIALVWIYDRISDRIAPAGQWIRSGLTFGLIAWFVAQVPLWLLWFAEQPWPDSLVVKQLALELASSLILGLVVAALARRARQVGNTGDMRAVG
jgi:hypothetical protein